MQARIIQGDCVQGMKACLEPESVGVVVTSPPYNRKTDYGVYADDLTMEEYLKWTAIWAGEVQRVLATDGSFFLNLGGAPKDPWFPMRVMAVLEPIFVLQNAIIWVKSIAVDRPDGEAVNMGHYRPISSQRFLNGCYEFVFHLTKTGSVPIDRLAIGVPYRDKSNARRWKSAHHGLRCRGNTWFIPYETTSSRERDRPHPASFPPRLPEMCIRLHGVSRCGLVLDPFCGIGSTGVACARLGVDFVGIDINPAYCERALEDIECAGGLVSMTRLGG